MSSLPYLLLAMLLLPLLGSVLLLWLEDRLDEPLGGYAATAFAAMELGLAVAAMVVWLQGSGGVPSLAGFGGLPYVQSFRWAAVGGQSLDLQMYVDSLTIVMLAMITFVNLAVTFYSIAYLRGDKRFTRFFAYLLLFVFSIVGLVLSGSLVGLLIFWELVGLCSYLLIGFWHEKPAARSAAIKAFLTNRVGDVGFIVGMGMFVAYLGSATLPELWVSSHVEGMPHTLMTVAGVLVFCGAIGKSAQFPLQTWLPDAMAGPTPASAMIHAATMVAAGVFLLARVFPLLTTDARLFIAIVGATTITVGTLCALAQRDIKRALAYSTMAQLGYMVLAIGLGSWIGATFHLLTHAFFKSLLFLSAGSVLAAMHHESRLERFGGLWRHLPVTTIAFAIGSLAMAGAPYLSGFYSKELIIGHAAAWSALARDDGRSAVLSLLLWIPVIAAYLTPLYLTRLWVLTFFGRTRDRSLSRHAREAGVLSFPLVMLSGLAIVAGYGWFPVRSMVESAVTETQHYVQAFPQTISVDPLAGSWPVPQEAVDTDADTATQPADPLETRVTDGATRAASLTGWAWLVGMIAGFAIYARGFELTDRLAKFVPFHALRRWLASGMYFDDLYALVLVAPTQALSWAATAIDRNVLDPAIDFTARSVAQLGRTTAYFDQQIVDGVVRSTAAAAWQGAAVARGTQGGRVRVYVASAVLTLALGAAVVLWMVI